MTSDASPSLDERVLALETRSNAHEADHAALVSLKSKVLALESQTGSMSSKAQRNAFPSPFDSIVRLQKPHSLFPFDLFSFKVAQAFLPETVKEELTYVRDHAMTPPFPWGHAVYHHIIEEQLLHVDGEFAELGVGAGGTSMFLARLAKKYGRKFLAVDSFAGLPEPDLGKDNHYFLKGDYRPEAGEDNYTNFMKYKERFGVEDTVTVIKSFFSDLTVPPEFQSLAFVHLDSDLYDSVYDSLERVWDLVSVGGCIAVDDFFHHAQGPARAVGDFFRRRSKDGVEPPLLYVIPTYAVLIIKGHSGISMAGGEVQTVSHPRSLDGNFYSFKIMRNYRPFVQATVDCVNAAHEALKASRTSGLDEKAQSAIERVVVNAESFLSFLRYPDTAAKSGADVSRYVVALEDLFDFMQGSYIGLGLDSQERNHIEFKI